MNKIDIHSTVRSLCSERKAQESLISAVLSLSAVHLFCQTGTSLQVMGKEDEAHFAVHTTLCLVRTQKNQSTSTPPMFLCPSCQQCRRRSRPLSLGLFLSFSPRWECSCFSFVFRQFSCWGHFLLCASWLCSSTWLVQHRSDSEQLPLSLVICIIMEDCRLSKMFNIHIEEKLFLDIYRYRFIAQPYLTCFYFLWII